jgi:bifunctional non-homologous end joining protein LigD
VPSSAGRGIGSLLGHYQGKELIYDGRAGTGFTEASSIAVEDQLRPLIVKQAVLQRVPREHTRRAVWVKPKRVCEVKFTARTDEGYLRQASFKGLPEDKRPEDVTKVPGRCLVVQTRYQDN